jgi:CHAT domain-containing protein
MDEYQRSAYLEVIQALSVCPYGEEASVYEKFPHLVDTNLVEIMWEYGGILESEGKCNGCWKREAEKIGVKMLPLLKLNRQVNKLHVEGRIREATPIGERALIIAREIFPSPHEELVVHLSNLASLYRSQGSWVKAEPLYDEALKISRALYGDRPTRSLAISLSNLADLYTAENRLVEAETLHHEALKIFHALYGNRPNQSLAVSLNNLALLYREQGRLVEAETLHHEALKISLVLYGDQPNNTLALSLNNLALLYTEQGRLVEAEYLHDEALKIRRELYSDLPNNDLASSLNDLALLYVRQGHLVEAEALHDEALNIRRELYSDRPNNDLALSLINLAMIYIITFRHTAALELLIQSTQVQNQVLINYFTYATPENQHILLESMHENLEFFAFYVTECHSDNPIAVEALLDAIFQRKAASTISSVILKRAQFNDRYPHLRDSFDQWAELKIQLANTGDNETRKPLEAQCRQIQQTLSLQVPEIRTESLDITRQTIATYLPPFTQLVEFFRFNVSDSDDTLKLDRYIAFILSQDLTIPVRMIDLGLAEPIDVAISKYRETVQKNEKSMGMSDRPPLLESKISAEIIDGCALRAAILDPILQHLPPTDTLIFAADSELYRVPFAILPLGTLGTRLIDKYRVETLTAARDLRRRYDQTDRPSSAPIIVGDPDYDYGSSHSLPVIPHPDKQLEPIMGGNFQRMEITEKLVSSIARQLNVTPYINTQATSPIFQQQSPKILLVATHGFAFPNNYHRQQQDAWQALFQCAEEDDEKVIAKYRDAIDLDFRIQLEQLLDRDPNSSNANWYRALLAKIDNHLFQYQHSRQITKELDPMLRCGIALTGANHWLQNQPLAPEVGQGVLLAHDIAQLNLWGTELAVLVACSTALGDTTNGQGIFGLRRAFALSGAKHTIASLWNVPVNASILLMERFFDLFQADMPPAEALDLAQKYIRTISIAQLRTTEIGRAGIEGLEAADKIDRDIPEDFQPWQSPYYWGAWICQG